MANEFVLIRCRAGIYLKVFLILTIILSGESHSQNVWNWIQPVPTGNLLYSVSFPEANTGYAAGAFGTIIKTTDGGLTWALQSSQSDKDLSEILFVNSNTGFAAGKDGIILRTSDGGKNWFQCSSGVSSYLHDIFFINETAGYITGLSGTILKTKDGGIKWQQPKSIINASLFCMSFLNESTGVIGGYNTILKTINGGKTFTQLNADIDPSTAVTGIAYADSITIYAAGNSPHGIFYKSVNAGLNWTKTSLDLPYLFGGSVDLVRSICFVDKNSGYIITDFGTILRTSTGGINWTKDSSFRPSYAKSFTMYDINFSDALHINISGGGGTIIRSTDGGIKWFTAAGNKKTIYKSCFTDNSTGFAVGENGSVIKTENGGSSWDSLDTFTTKALRAIYFEGDKTGYVAGDRGVIFKTTDLGRSWTDQTHYTNLDYNDIRFINEIGIAAGGNPENGRAFIFKTDNGGVNWYEVYDSLGFGVLNSVAFLNNTNWFAAGSNGDILKSFDAGESWHSYHITDEDLRSISFSDPLNGFIAGTYGAVFKTEDGGNEWERKFPGPVNTLNSINYPKAGKVIIAGNSGTIVTSDDGGNSWSIIPKITTNELFAVSEVNDELFAFGEYGTILSSKVSGNTLASVSDKEVIDPAAYLYQNFPNPFNPETVINYSISKSSNVILKVYDARGREVNVLINKIQNAGKYGVTFTGNDLAGGIYFYSLSIDNRIVSAKKMLVLK
ncbi:MAG: YCF48-related protein [Ignavibacteria bacterium]